MSPTRLVYALKAGDQLGDYRVIRPLGAGGMGEVYLVEHQHLRKRYALKILPAEAAQDETFIDRFRIEARVMADIEHPGIVRVHNFGEAQGRYFLVMDYVSGPDGAPRTLDDELAWGNKMPEAAVLEIALQLCDALDYAHTFPAGAIIHRDLKPGNILIHFPGSHTAPSGSQAKRAGAQEMRVKIADFGLAKIVGSDYIRAVIDRSTHLTAMPVRALSADAQATEIDTAGGSTVSLLGTYDYMSPEQKVGGAVDERSDLYAIGLILYRMLTGHKPEGTYDPPSKAGVSRRWDPILARCLQRDAAQRYPSARDLKQDLLAMKTPAHRRVPALALAAIAASLCTTAVVLGVVGWRPKTGSGGNEPRPQSDQPPEQQSAETFIPFRVDAKPAGARLTIRRGAEVLALTQTIARAGTEVALRPGLYRFRIEREGYRPIERDIAVAQDQPARFSATLEQAFGFLHMLDSEEQHIALIASDGKQLTAITPERAPDRRIFKLPTGAYEIMVTRTNYEPASRRIELRDEETVELRVALAPMPGSLLVRSAVPAEIWEGGHLVGQTGEWIRKTPPGERTLELRNPAYRPASITVTVPPNGEAAVDAPPLEEKRALLTAKVEIRVRTVAPEHLPRRGTLRIGSAEPFGVDLPWSGDVKELDKPLALELLVEGYDVSRSDPVTLRDGERRTVTFRLVPNPVRLTILSNVPAGIYRLRDGQFAQGWKRTVFGRDIPIGQTGEPLTVDAFLPQKLTIAAEGYQPLTVDVHMLRPGASDETLKVELIPTPVE